MDCHAAREALSPPERPRGSVAELVRARRHVRRCSACHDILAEDSRIRSVLRQVQQQKAPPELRARVLEALAREAALDDAGTRPRRRPAFLPDHARWILAATGFALAAAALAIVVAPGLFAPASEPPAEIFIEDFVRRAVSEEQIVSSDPAEVARFLTRELGRPAAPFVVEGLRITKAEICLLGDRRGAMVLYDLDGTTVSHYFLPRRTASGEPLNPAVRRLSGLDAQALPAVVVWATASLEQALVGTVSPRELETLVHLAEAGSGSGRPAAH